MSRKNSKKTIWLATMNPNKAKEFKEILKGWNVKTLDDLTKPLIINETGTTFEENAMIKAKALAGVTGQPAIGEDSGLCVKGLDDFPGIYSHRWAFPETDYKKINQKLLKKMSDAGLTDPKDRTAQFVSVIAYYDPAKGTEKTFRGTVTGTIVDEPKGDDGFGYDPIFRPLRHHYTFAEMSDATKNKISHRASAISQLKSFLNNQLPGWPTRNWLHNLFAIIFSGED